MTWRSWAWAPPAPQPSTNSPGAGSEPWASTDSRRRTSTARRMGTRASLARPSARARPTRRWSSAPMRSGASSKPTPAWICSRRAAGHHRHEFLASTIACANRYGIKHELLNAADIAARFPQFGVDGTESAYYEPTAGFVRPERCVAAELTMATRLGAEIRRDERVLAIEPAGNVVRVRTQGGIIEAEKVVMAVGAWVHDFVGADQVRLFNVYRQVLNWFELERDAVDH